MKTRFIKSVLLLSLTLFSAQAFATVEWLTVNHITKELYWAETDRTEGFIGWEVIPEGNYHEALEMYSEKGYSVTTYPFKVETVLGIFILLILPIFYLLLKKKKRANA